MIHITIFENEKNECIGFQTEGHAGYAESGEDIVCAAASMLVLNTMNAIEAFASDEYSVMADEDTGMISWHLSDSPSKEAELLLKTMILGLKDMASDENYAEYIELTFEEV